MSRRMFVKETHRMVLFFSSISTEDWWRIRRVSCGWTNRRRCLKPIIWHRIRVNSKARPPGPIPRLHRLNINSPCKKLLKAHRLYSIPLWRMVSGKGKHFLLTCRPFIIDHFRRTDYSNAAAAAAASTTSTNIDIATKSCHTTCDSANSCCTTTNHLYRISNQWFRFEMSNIFDYTASSSWETSARETADGSNVHSRTFGKDFFPLVESSFNDWFVAFRTDRSIPNRLLNDSIRCTNLNHTHLWCHSSR